MQVTLAMTCASDTWPCPSPPLLVVLETLFSLSLSLTHTLLKMLDLAELENVNFKSLKEEETDAWVEKILQVCVLRLDFSST